MNKFLLCGASLNSGNKGVNALTRGAITAIVNRYPNANIRILSYTITKKVINKINIHGNQYLIEEIPSSTKVVLKYLTRLFLGLTPRITIGSIIEEVMNADIIMDISEGDSFSDIYGIKRFIQHSSMKLFVEKLKKKLILMPQTVGPFNGALTRKVVKYIVNNASGVFVRDRISEEVLIKEIGISEHKIKYIPDLAFYMEKNNLVDLKKLFPEVNKFKNIIGLNVSALLYNGGYTEKNMFNFKTDYKVIIDSVIKYFLEEDNSNCIVLVPHVIASNNRVEDDMYACKTIYEKYKDTYKNKLFFIDKEFREDEIKTLISSCNFFIGGRMHACIGAISTSVPTVPIAYSRKFIGIWRDLGMEKCVSDPRQNTLDEIINIISENFDSKEKIKVHLEYINKDIKDKIISIFNYI